MPRFLLGVIYWFLLCSVKPLVQVSTLGLERYEVAPLIYENYEDKPEQSRIPVVTQVQSTNATSI